MANRFILQHEEFFSGIDQSVNIQHNLGHNLYFLQVVDTSGFFHPEWIDDLVVDIDDPLNIINVELVSSGLSGSIQVIDADILPVVPGARNLSRIRSFFVDGKILLPSGIRPSVNGSGLALLGEGVEAGVNSINSLSGVVGLGSGTTNAIIVTTSGNDILLDLDPTKTESILTLSGISKLQTAEEIAFQSTTSTSFVEVLSLSWSVPSSGTYRAQWSFQGACSQANKQCNFRIQLDNSALAPDLMNMQTSFNVAAGNLQFGGFAQFGIDAGTHTVDFDFRFADTGGGAVEVDTLRLEVLRVN